MTVGIKTYVCLCNTHICVYACWNMHHHQHRSKKWAREKNNITCTYLKEWTLFYCRWNHLVMVTENFPLVFYTILHPELPVNTLVSWNELGNIPSVGNIPAWSHKHLHNQTHPCLFPGHPSKDDSLIQLSVWAKHILIPGWLSSYFSETWCPVWPLGSTLSATADALWGAIKLEFFKYLLAKVFLRNLVAQSTKVIKNCIRK